MTRPYPSLMVRLLPAFLAALVCLAPALPAQAQSTGGVDWASLRVAATGLGAPPAGAVNAAQARALAQRAAVTVARRNLLEVVKGLRIDSTTLVANAIVVDDRILSQVEGFIQGSNVDEVKYFSDGSAQATVSMPITGDLARLLLPLAKVPDLPPARPAPAPAAPQASPCATEIADLNRRLAAVEGQLSAQQAAMAEQAKSLAELARQIAALAVAQSAAQTSAQAAVPAPAPAPAATPTTSPETEARLTALLNRLETMETRLASLETPASPVPAAAPSTTSAPWTGLVVDARGLGYTPCLKPALVLDGELFYPGSGVAEETAVSSGYARFYRKIEQAQRSSSAGSLPLTVAATTLADGGGLVLDTAKADSLHALLAEPTVLSRCRVAIVF